MPSTIIGGGRPAILEDPGGTRVRWMRRAGRVVFVLFLGWLLAIVLGGLGLIPVKGIPLAHAMRPSQGPPELAKLPEPAKPSASDLLPALPAGATVRAAVAEAPARRAGSTAQPAGKRAAAQGRTETTPRRKDAPGKSAEAPGRTKTAPAAGGSHGRSAAAPGKTKVTPPPAARGKSAQAPGRTTTSPAAGGSHGKGGTAPAHTSSPPPSRAGGGGSASAPGRTSSAPPSGPKPKKR